jgi:two-component sensor histidine kinase
MKFKPGSIGEVRNRLTDFTLIILSILGLPAIVISLMRMSEFGWMPAMGIHMGVYLSVVVMCLFRGKISHQFKTAVILALAFVIGSASFPSLAAAGSGVFFYLTTVVLGTIFYGFRGGMTALVLCIAGLLSALFATHAGYIHPRVDLNVYSLSTPAWISKIAAFTLLGGLSLGLMSLMQEWLTGSIHEMAEEIEEHRRTEIKLENSLGEKEVLLQEVHHRVKSNLQAISGLLDLHIARDGDDLRKTLSDSRNRIRVMARIHEELYGSEDITSVDFSAFLTKLISDIVDSLSPDPGKIALDLRLEPIALVMDTAIPCGLIVNELVTNSIKYAFPDQRRGIIRVEFSQVGEEQYRLVVADDGVGISYAGPEEGHQSTLGMRLIKTFSEQLGIESGFTVDKGTTFTMLFREYREAGAQIY